MIFRSAFRRLSNSINRHTRSIAKPAGRTTGENIAPISDKKPPQNKASLALAERAARSYHSVKSLVIRAYELFDSNFRAKVLLPVAGCMAVAMGATFYVVDHRIAKQLEQDARNTLATANAVIRYSQDFRRNDLLMRFHNLPNEALWRQVFQFGQAKDLHKTLGNLMEMQHVDILFYASTSGRIIDVEKNDPGIPVAEFEAAAAPALQLAVRGDERADTVCVGGKLYDVTTVPAYNLNNEEIGVLALGSELGGAAAQEFGNLTQSHVALMANGRVTASTLPGLEANPQFAGAFGRTMPADDGGDRAANVRSIVLNGVHYYCIAGKFPSLNANSNLGYVLLISREQSLEAMQTTQHTLAGMGLLAILLCVGAVCYWVNRLTEPFSELRQGAEAVGHGDLDRRVRVRSRDECGQLALVFNGMTEKIQQSRTQLEKTVATLKSTQEQLVQSEKLSAIGKFVAGVAHELNNPLTAVVGFSEVLKQSTTDKLTHQHSETILKAALRCKRIVQSLLSFARREQSERKLVSINSLVEMVLEIVGYTMRASNIEMVTRLDPALPMVLVDVSQIQQVLLNIVNNAQEAIQATGRAGRIQIVTETGMSNIRISIQDDGPGIPEEHLRRLFDPFFTTKEIGKGTGLGLSLCYGYIKEQGGTITPMSEVGKGATFLIELPIPGKTEEPADYSDIQTPPEMEKPDPHEGEGKRVLVIDDEKPILTLIEGDLKRRGYQVETVEDGKAALRELEKSHFDLAFCDWKMPGFGGQQIYEQLRRTNPQFCQRIIFITGDVINDQMRQFLETERRPCLSKPFALSELHTTARDVFKSVGPENAQTGNRI
ncbi:MAG TPA: ATP-binding protein [Verrucomicrobiae bacterium]|nr:ATP-binding protein [Verrucomicrobiae bacterium]